MTIKNKQLEKIALDINFFMWFNIFNLIYYFNYLTMSKKKGLHRSVWKLIKINQEYYKKIKEKITGKDEEEFNDFLREFGYIEDLDYFRQYPAYDLYFLDFAFPNNKIAIEYDEKHHLEGIQKQLDKIRDNFLISKGWVVIRIKQKKYKKQKRLIKNKLKFLLEDLLKVKNFDNIIKKRIIL